MTVPGDISDQTLFTGLRVVDAGSFIAAPSAATILGDFGAEVIKLEPARGGDPWRHQFRRPGAPVSAHNYFWIMAGRNKKSLAVDLKRPEGQDILGRLMGRTDVFITNLPFAARDRLRIGHAALLAQNERLIYASFSAFGEAGPEMHRPGFDATAWWLRSGLGAQIRSGPDAEPLRTVSGMGDHMGALALFGAITAGLYRRAHTGRGGLVGTSLLATGAYSNANLIQAALCGADVLPPATRDDVPNPLQAYYPTKGGGWLMLVVTFSPTGNDWERLLAALDDAALAGDPRFATATARAEHRRALVAALDGVFRTRSATEWAGRLAASQVPYEVMAGPNAVARDPQMRAAGAIVATSDEVVAETVSSPLWLHGSPKRTPRPPPGLGEHTAPLLEELGYDAMAIAALAEQGVITRASHGEEA